MGKVPKTVQVPQVEYVDNHVHVPVHKHHHVPMVSVAQKHVEVAVIQTVEKIVDVPVVKQIDVPQVTTIEKIVEVPHMQTIEKVVEVPVAGQTLQGAERHVNVPLPTVRQMGPAENVTVTEIGAPLPVEHAGQVIKAPPVQAPVPPPVMTVA